MSKKDSKNNKFIIKLLKERDDNKLTFTKESPLPLPQPHFTQCIIGPSMSGKGIVWLNTFFREDMMGGVYDVIIVVSPTISNDRNSYIIKESKHCILYDDPTQLDNIVDELMEIQEVGEGEILDDKPKILLVLDDCLGFLDKRTSNMTKFISKNRHYSVSVVCVIQSYRFLNNAIRSNSHYFVIKKLNNQLEENKVAEEIGTTFCKVNDFKNYYYYATEGRYDFLYCDMRLRRLYKNYDELIFDGENTNQNSITIPNINQDTNQNE